MERTTINRLISFLMVTLVVSLLLLGSAYAQNETVPVDTVAEDEINPDLVKYAFELDYVNGVDTLSLKEIAQREKPIVVFFWLNDCPLCHLQLPYVQKMQTYIENGDLDIELVSINLDFQTEDAEVFIEEKGISFTVLHDPRGRYTEDAYHVEDLCCPMAYIFDKDGNFVDYLTGFRSQFTKAVLSLLEIEIPESLK